MLSNIYIFNIFDDILGRRKKTFHFVNDKYQRKFMT